MNLPESIDRLIEASERTRRDRALKKTEAWLAKKMGRAFKAQKKAFFAALPAPVLQEAEPGQPGFPKWESAWQKAEEATRGLFAVPAEEAIRISLVAGAENVIAQTGAAISYSIETPAVVEYASKHAAELVTKVNATTKEVLNTIVTNGMEQGLSYGEIAGQIESRFSDFAVSWPQEHIQNRAHAVAVYETGDAYEEGNEQVAAELEADGLEMEKSWLTVGDSRVRSSHAANQDEGWIEMGQAFQSGNYRPPTDPGCRCSTLYRMKPGVGLKRGEEEGEEVAAEVEEEPEEGAE